MSNDKFKVKKGIKLETNSTASDEAGEIRFDGTDIKYYSGGAEKTIANTSIVSGTNTGDVTLTAAGSTPAAAGASLSGQALTLQPADATNPGIVSTGAQTFAGAKTFSSTIVGSINGNAATVTTNANLSGDVSSVGNTTTIGATKVTNAMLAGSIDVTTKLNGAVPIANGGTNNASLAVTAGGALYTDGSKIVNVGAGTSGQVLTSAGASAPTWAAPALAYTYTAQTSGYTAVISDYVNCTSGTFTVTLPTAVSQAGKSIKIKNSGTGVITINTTSSQTIDTYASGVIKLGSKFDCIVVTSDGANWVIDTFDVFVGSLATTSTTAATTSAPYVFTSETYDTQGNYNNSTGVFTVSISGRYRIVGAVYNGATNAVLRVYVNGSNVAQGPGLSDSSRVVGVVYETGSAANAGDTFELRPDTNATATGGATINYFSVSRIR
jgi:hypothetical protein